MSNIQETTPPPVLQLFNIYPIRTSLLSFLSERDIILLSATCRKLRTLLGEIWDINIFLSTYFSSADKFRSMMSQTEALISGMSALNFLCRNRGNIYYDSFRDTRTREPLNVYIRWKPEMSEYERTHYGMDIDPNSGALKMVNYLIDEEEYSLQGVSMEDLVKPEGEINTWFHADGEAKWLYDAKAEDLKDLYEPAKIGGIIRLSKATAAYD